MKMQKKVLFAGFIIMFLSLVNIQNLTAEVVLSKGQTLYVPIFSKISLGGRNRSLSLSATLSICNTDLYHKITILSIQFYDDKGKLIREHLEKEVELEPMASLNVFLSEAENNGGIGANFLVKWQSSVLVNKPLVECVMIGTQSGQGISFGSVGHEITTENR